MQSRTCESQYVIMYIITSYDFKVLLTFDHSTEADSDVGQLLNIKEDTMTHLLH